MIPIWMLHLIFDHREISMAILLPKHNSLDLMLHVWFGGYSFAASWIQQLHAISMIQLPPQVIYKNATYRSSGWTEVG